MNITNEQLLLLLALDYGKFKEDVPRQITNIQPARDVHPEVRKYTMADQVASGKRRAFEADGVVGLVEKQEDALIVAATIAKYKYAVANGYISDIGTGLYSMITKDEGLYDYRELIDSKTGEPVSARITLSVETLYKAAFGPLVDKNGRAVTGAGDIVKQAKKEIMPIIYGDKIMPKAHASIERINQQGERISVLLEGTPLKIHRVMSAAENMALVIDLDYYFFPTQQRKDNKLKAKGQFIHQIAGLTSFLKLGSLIENQRNPHGKKIDSMTARRMILAVQAAYELKSFAPDMVKENNSGRFNISLRKRSVKDLYPSAVNSATQRINYKEFSDGVATMGRYVNNAISATGIWNYLMANDDIVIPAMNKGAEFPEDKKNIVYVKVDRPNKKLITA